MSTIRSNASATAPNASLRPLLLAGVIGGVAASVINVLLYVVGQALEGGSLLMTMPGATAPEPLELFMVLALSLGPGVIAGLAFWGLARYTANPARWFLVLAGVVYLAFLPGPFTVADSAVTIAVLELMHLGAAVPIVFMLLRANRRSAQ